MRLPEFICGHCSFVYIVRHTQLRPHLCRIWHTRFLLCVFFVFSVLTSDRAKTSCHLSPKLQSWTGVNCWGRKGKQGLPWSASSPSLPVRPGRRSETLTRVRSVAVPPLTALLLARCHVCTLPPGGLFSNTFFRCSTMGQAHLATRVQVGSHWWTCGLTCVLWDCRRLMSISFFGLLPHLIFLGTT